MTLEARLDLLITQLGADYKSQQSSISTLIASVGTLSGLSTTAKNNLVSAINEIYALAQSGSSVISDTTTSASDKTWSINKIKTELGTIKSELLGGVPATAFDTLKEIADYISGDQTATSGMITALGNRVSYTQADNKTNAEKTQARQNIDAYGLAEIGEPNTDLVALYNLAKA